MRLPILHPDPCLRSNLWVGGAEDDVTHTVTPSGAAVSPVPVTIASVPSSTEGTRNSPGVLVEAEDDVLAWLALAPFVTVVYIGVSKVSDAEASCARIHTMSGDDAVQVEHMCVECIPEGRVFPEARVLTGRLGRTRAQLVIYVRESHRSVHVRRCRIQGEGSPLRPGSWVLLRFA